MGQEEDDVAISTTTFEERLARISKGETGNPAVKVERRKARRSFGARLMTFPCLVGLGILSGGTAYAWVATNSELPDVAVNVPQILNNIQWVMAFTG